MPRANPNLLLVEGDDDKRVIPYFMEKFIPWGDKKEAWPVEIQPCNGIEIMLEELPGLIEAEVKSPGRKAFGIIADANEHPESHWQRIRDRSVKWFAELPEQLPEQGIVCANADGLRFGVWLMPDNRSRGMLETFLHSCVPDGNQPLWTFVQTNCIEAKKHKAPNKDVHRDKAAIHAWLALQDPPGQSLHLAVQTNTLKPDSPHAATFVQWFRSLYGL